MKSKTIVLLGSLLLAQTTVIPFSAHSNVMSSMEIQRRGHKAHVEKHYEHERYRSVLPVATGYVEDGVLYLSFSLPLSNTQIRVVDSETSKTVFEGIVSGTSCSIPLDRDSESFEIYF